jgi:hypothetical protein
VTIKVEAAEVAEDAAARMSVPATTDETAAAVGASEP